MPRYYSPESERHTREFADFLLQKVGYTSYKSLADQIGVTGPVVGSWVKGEFQPRGNNLGKLSAVLDLNEAEMYYLYSLTHAGRTDSNGSQLEKAVTSYYDSADTPSDEQVDDFLRAVRTFGMATLSIPEAKNDIP